MNSVWIKSLKEGGEYSYHRRAINHDYYAPFIYHIVLKKIKSCEPFGTVIGDVRIAPGLPGSANTDESGLGKIIAKEIVHLPYDYPIIKLHQFKVMPDHVHILLQVLFRSDKHLDFYVDTLRKRIARKYKNIYGSVKTDEEIFEDGYCDKPLYDNRSLDALYEYIRQNPHRLAMRQQFPQFFQHIRSLKIGEEEFAAYGNLFLFRNPDKEAVKISRKFTQAEKEEKSKGWITAASKGTVLVSPFISSDEKNIRSVAESLDAKIILITHEAFKDSYKPAAHDFALCAEGRLLIISLGLPSKTALTRTVCERMNALAKAIADM
ncbi:MAG: transposase [Muribaculaceae bacterium]|nr:transposase [Muribaculaceae bacterium]